MRGQTGLEFMLVIGISLAMLVPLYAYITSYTAENRQDLKVSALEDNLEAVAEAADIVYSQGYPAKMTIKFYVPDSVESYNIINEQVLVMSVFYGNRPTDVTAKTDAIVNGTLPTNPGFYQVSLTMDPDGWVNVSY